MLSSLDPSYLAVVACQPDERASEFAARDETRVLGILTYALLGLLASRNDEERSRLRWADLWPQLLDGVAARCRQGSRRAQHPSLIGRSERRVFGGTWQEQDPGYRITSLDDGRYRIAAGTLMGLTRGAEVAIYGPEPARFPPIGSEEDSPVGRLRVLAAERAECTAEAMGATFATEGARARLVKPGEGERLSVSLDPENSALAEELALSPLLKIVPAGSPDADVEVVREVGGGWIIGDDVEAALARVRPGDTEALRSGLEWCYRGQAALRLAYRCTDPQLSRSLHLELLDCSNAEALEAMSPQEQADPKLPLAPRDDAGIYQVPPASQWCVRVTNRSESTLMVHVLRCSAGGSVELLGDATLRPRASHILWQGDRFGDAFSARGDWLPRQRGAEPRRFVTDRLLAIGTNRSGVDLSALLADRTVQEVVRETVRGDGPRGSRLLNQPAAAPAELWTAAIVPMRIRR